MQLLIQLIVILTGAYIILVLFRSFFIDQNESGIYFQDLDINYKFNSLNLLKIKNITKDIILNKLDFSNKNNIKINIKGHISSTNKNS